MFVDDTVATASGDQAAADEAKASLDAHRTEFAAFIDSASDGELAAETYFCAIHSGEGMTGEIVVC